MESAAKTLAVLAIMVSACSAQQDTETAEYADRCWGASADSGNGHRFTFEALAVVRSGTLAISLRCKGENLDVISTSDEAYERFNNFFAAEWRRGEPKILFQANVSARFGADESGSRQIEVQRVHAIEKLPDSRAGEILRM